MKALEAAAVLQIIRDAEARSLQLLEAPGPGFDPTRAVAEIPVAREFLKALGEDGWCPTEKGRSDLGRLGQARREADHTGEV